MQYGAEYTVSVSIHAQDQEFCGRYLIPDNRILLTTLRFMLNFSIHDYHDDIKNELVKRGCP